MARGRIVRGVARTAVVAGTATAVSHNVNKRMNAGDAAKQQEAQAQADAQNAQAPQQDVVAQLQQLTDLKAKGALSEEEFQAAKKKLMQ